MVLLAAAASLSGALVLCPVRSAQNEPEAAPRDSSQSSLGTDAKTDSPFARDPDFAGKSSYDLGRSEFFIRTMLAVVFVIVLGAAAIYVSRKLLPKIAARSGKEIRIVETVHLGPRKAVHLIEVGKRRFLIGSTNENIRKLAEVTAGFPDLSEHDVDLGSERL
jgi:flagellar biosynthetic protein FliO